jgi:hypothetical protein
MEERVRTDSLKLMNALGYDFCTLEFAVRDGIPYAIDFLNPAPDAAVESVGEDNFQWVVETAAKWLLERVEQPAEPLADYRWQTFLAGGESVAPAKKTNGHSRAKAGSPRPSPAASRRGDA